MIEDREDERDILMLNWFDRLHPAISVFVAGLIVSALAAASWYFGG